MCTVQASATGLKQRIGATDIADKRDRRGPRRAAGVHRRPTLALWDDSRRYAYACDAGDGVLRVVSVR